MLFYRVHASSCTVLFAVIFGILAAGADGHTSLNLTLVSTIVDDAHWGYAVEAHTYPGLDPDLLVVTTRETGISIWNTSDPLKPVLVTTWTESIKVEGQAWDEDTQILMVVDIGRSGVWTFQLSVEDDGVHFEQMGFVTVSAAGALHGRFYKPGNGKTYGVVSNGYFVNVSSLIVVDLTDPAAPTVVSSFPMPQVLMMEGVFIQDGYAIVGGFHNDVFQVVDISNPADPAIVRTLAEPYYMQMVSSSITSPYSRSQRAGSLLDPNVLYTALWNDVGGLATFNMSDPAKLYEIGHIVEGDLGKANRVHLDDTRGLAFLPLQGHEVNMPGRNGGVAVVDVSDPANPTKVTVVRLPQTTMCYTLALIGYPAPTHVWAFGATTNTVDIYEIVD